MLTIKDKKRKDAQQKTIGTKKCSGGGRPLLVDPLV